VIEFPSIQPMESTTLAPESLAYVADLAERISLALRAVSTGRHVGTVDLRAAVAELAAVDNDVEHLSALVSGMFHDGRQQLHTERSLVGFLAGRLP
jgi:hypothetical protein